MMIGFSRHQDLPEPRAPLVYGLSERVRKRVGGKYLTRDPVPELLVGDPGRLLAAFDLLNSKTRVLSMTLSFHRDDIDVVAFNRGDPALRRTVAVVVELALGLAQAGIPESCRLPLVVGTHSHLGRLELNFIFPRGAINAAGLVRNYHPCPPTASGRSAWEALRDFLNVTFGWADPLDPARQQVVSGPSWLEAEVATADRAGVLFGRDQPQQAILQTLRRILPGKADAEELGAWRDEILADVGWRVIADTPTGCMVGPESGLPGSALLLGGTAFSNRRVLDLERQISQREASLRGSRDCLLSSWAKLADQNRMTLGKGEWPPIDPAAELDRILTTPRLRLPPHHPSFPAPVRAAPTGYRSRWTTVVDTAQALLRATFERLESQVLQNHFARLCAKLTPRLEHLAIILEKRNADRTPEFGSRRRPVGNRVEPAGDAVEGARLLAFDAADGRDDASARPDRGRSGGVDDERSGIWQDGRTPRPYRHARGHDSAIRCAVERVVEGTGRDSRGARLNAARRAAATVFPGAAIGVRFSKNEVGDDIVSLRIDAATLSIDTHALYLSAGALQAERLDALADLLGIRHEWGRDFDMPSDHGDEPDDTPLP
jgi:hypothetical protein